MSHCITTCSWNCEKLNSAVDRLKLLFISKYLHDINRSKTLKKNQAESGTLLHCYPFFLLKTWSRNFHLNHFFLRFYDLLFDTITKEVNEKKETKEEENNENNFEWHHNRVTSGRFQSRLSLLGSGNLYKNLRPVGYFNL